MSDPNKGRIAIKFGASSAPKNSRPNPPQSSLGKRQRPSAWGHDADSDSDGDSNHGRHETITGFGAEGAETGKNGSRKKEEKKEYVIARQPNRDWRSEVKAQRRGKNLLPEEARAQQNGHTIETEPADGDKGIKWGLTVKEKKAKQEDEGTEAHELDSVRWAEDSRPKTEEPDEKVKEEEKPQTADDEAMDVLLGRKKDKQADHVIHPSETDAFRRDMQTAGEASTLEDYEAMPVEEFGAALLRGMGWNGEERGAKQKEVKRRPARLGLGAKELKGAEDLGGWNQGGGKKRSRPRLDEYRREESKRKEGRRHEDSYKRERERDRDRDRDRDYDRHRHRHRDHDRDKRR